MENAVDPLEASWWYLSGSKRMRMLSQAGEHPDDHFL